MLGNRIKDLRLAKEITQEELGKLLNKTKNNISQYETGKRQPDNDTLLKLSEYFNVSIDYLLGKTDVRNNLDSNITVALHSEYDYKDLPDEARKEIENYIEFIKQKYSK